MTKTQLRVLQNVLDKAKRRASSTASDGEKLWLFTWIVPPLESVIGRAEGTVTEFQLRSDNNLPLSGRIS